MLFLINQRHWQRRAVMRRWGNGSSVPMRREWRLEAIEFLHNSGFRHEQICSRGDTAEAFVCGLLKHWKYPQEMW
jgi:hypothetical protein